ncbi:MAG: hypothetical protein IT285_04765 [Bdellovibrionales bacterium]|nr:hypothetical protein [Bdellovibrionales bacterium]
MRAPAEESCAWTHERLFFSSDDYFRDLIAAIDRARVSVRMESYIYQSGTLASRVSASLAAAARRGLKVKLMVDGMGSPFWGGDDAAMLESAGVECRVFWPPPWHFWQWPFARARAEKPVVGWLVWLGRSLAHVNRRNHRKLCLIDGYEAWIGSMNVTDEHLSRASGGSEWRDTGVRVEGPGVSALSEIFDRSWASFGFGSAIRSAALRIRGRRARDAWMNCPVRSNETLRKRIHFARDLRRRIASARTRLWITNAYFIPDLHLLRALRLAASAGADVRILLPGPSDVALVSWASSQFYASLLRCGVRIYEYLPGVLHAKSILADGWALVGSSNLNQRSLRHDLELDVVLNQAPSVLALERSFEADLSRAREIRLEGWARQGRLRRALGWLALLVRNFL